MLLYTIISEFISKSHRVFIPLELYVSSRSHPTETIPRQIFHA